MVERSLHMRKVIGSNPIAPTIKNLTGQVAKAAGSSPAKPTTYKISFGNFYVVGAFKFARQTYYAP